MGRPSTLGLLCRATGLVVWVTACGGGGQQEAPAEQNARGKTAPADHVAPTSQPGQTTEDSSLCSLISPEDVSAALGDKLPLGSPEETDSGCKYPVLFGVDGNTLACNKLSRANYDAFKNYENQSSVDFEYIDGLGQEAFVINNAQVCVLLGEDESLLVGAQVLAFEEALPITQEELKAGLIEIAHKVVAIL